MALTRKHHPYWDRERVENKSKEKAQQHHRRELDEYSCETWTIDGRVSGRNRRRLAVNIFTDQAVIRPF
jgi:hypothetical protein